MVRAKNSPREIVEGQHVAFLAGGQRERKSKLHNLRC